METFVRLATRLAFLAAQGEARRKGWKLSGKRRTAGTAEAALPSALPAIVPCPCHLRRLPLRRSWNALAEANLFTDSVIFLGWFVGGLASGVSGFGAMMLALPVLTLVLEPRDAILVCCIVAGPCCVQLAWLYRRFVSWPDMKRLWIGCIPGCVLGTLTLMAVPAGWLQIGISLLIVLFLAVQLLGARTAWTLPGSPACLLAAGCASGFCGATVSIVGLPMGISVLLRHWDKDRARGTMGIFLCSATLSPSRCRGRRDCIRPPCWRLPPLARLDAS